MQISTPKPVFSSGTEEEDWSEQDFRIVADYAFAISSSLSVIIESRRCPWRFCNGQKCYEAFATGINVTKLYMGQAVYASSVGHFLSAQIATCSPQRAIALHETGGTFLHTRLAVHCRPSVLQSHSSKSYLSFSLAAFQRENFPQSTYFRQLQDSHFPSFIHLMSSPQCKTKSEAELNGNM